VQSLFIEIENYLFFQMTPFLCLLNVKQTKIRGYFIFRNRKSARLRQINSDRPLKPESTNRKGRILRAGFAPWVFDQTGSRSVQDHPFDSD
jgi:hypothetical protein